MNEKLVVRGDYRVTGPVCAAGAPAYLVGYNPDTHRVQLWSKSTSDQWVEAWEGAEQAGNYRYETITPDHPLYDRLDPTDVDADTLGLLNAGGPTP